MLQFPHSLQDFSNLKTLSSCDFFKNIIIVALRAGRLCFCLYLLHLDVI